jgi:hypothetical protein
MTRNKEVTSKLFIIELIWQLSIKTVKGHYHITNHVPELDSQVWKKGTHWTAGCLTFFSAPVAAVLFRRER